MKWWQMLLVYAVLTLAWIDQTLISYVERVSHLIQMLTGWDCFDQERACYVSGALAFIYNFVRSVHEMTNLPTRLVLAAFVFCLSASILSNAFIPTRSDDTIRQNAQQGLRNHRQLNPFGILVRFLYTVVLVQTLLLSEFNGNSVFVISLWCAFYLSACTPAPPAPKQLPVPLYSE